jgi:formate C-acetyltransferase
MSLGRTSTFLDVFIERDLQSGLITETEAQEIIDDFVIKLRIVRFLRTPEYDSLFSGDPTWVTETIGGMGEDGRPLVTKNSFRFLQTLYNLGPAPEPNMTVFWSPELPQGSRTTAHRCPSTRRPCSTSRTRSSAPRAMTRDRLLREPHARRQADAVLRCAREPRQDAALRDQRRPRRGHRQAGLAGDGPVGDGPLDFDDVMERFDKTMDWLAETYVEALNCIHWSHDKYAYERIEMALHDKDVLRTMACGIAGLSVAADSLSAIKYATVTPVRDERGIVVDYLTEASSRATATTTTAPTRSLSAWWRASCRRSAVTRCTGTPCPRSRCSRSPRTSSTARRRATRPTVAAPASRSPRAPTP